MGGFFERLGLGPLSWVFTQDRDLTWTTPVRTPFSWGSTLLDLSSALFALIIDGTFQYMPEHRGWSFTSFRGRPINLRVRHGDIASRATTRDSTHTILALRVLLRDE